MVHASLGIQAGRLAMQYMNAMFIKTDLEKLRGLLGKTEIIWIRNDVATRLSLDEMTERFENGFIKNMLEVDMNKCEIIFNELTPRIKLNTIQEWNGAQDTPRGFYVINSDIKFEMQRDENEGLFIAKVVHEYWNKGPKKLSLDEQAVALAKKYVVTLFDESQPEESGFPLTQKLLEKTEITWKQQYCCERSTAKKKLNLEELTQTLKAGFYSDMTNINFKTKLNGLTPCVKITMNKGLSLIPDPKFTIPMSSKIKFEMQTDENDELFIAKIQHGF